MADVAANVVTLSEAAGKAITVALYEMLVAKIGDHDGTAADALTVLEVLAAGAIAVLASPGYEDQVLERFITGVRKVLAEGCFDG